MDQFKFKVGEQVTYIGNSFGLPTLGIGTVVENIKLDYTDVILVLCEFESGRYTTTESELHHYLNEKGGFAKWIASCHT